MAETCVAARAAYESPNFFLLFPVWMFPSKKRGLGGLSTMKTLTTLFGRSEAKIFSDFSRFGSLFNSRGFDDAKEFQPLFPARRVTGA